MRVRSEVVHGLGSLLAAAAAVFWLSACSAPAGGDADGSHSKRAALSATSVTQSADELRTGWYPNQPELSPSVVSGSTFGPLFSAAVDDQIYAQPLVSQGTLFVATETNHIYGLDPETGATRWTQSLGVPLASGDIQCNDVNPAMGISGTPVIDSATNIAYFFVKRYVTGSSGPLTHRSARGRRRDGRGASRISGHDQRRCRQ